MSRLICPAQGFWRVTCPARIGTFSKARGAVTAHVSRRDGQAVLSVSTANMVRAMFLPPSPRRYFTMEATPSASGRRRNALRPAMRRRPSCPRTRKSPCDAESTDFVGQASYRQVRGLIIRKQGRCIVDLLLHRPRFYRLRRPHWPLAPTERLDLGCSRSQGALEARAGEWFAVEPHANCKRSCPRGERASANRALSALVRGRSAAAWVVAADRQI